jgi:hypothetical protein
MTAATNTKPVAPKTIPPLPADLDAALRRLKLATVRRNATEVLQVAKRRRGQRTPRRVGRAVEHRPRAAPGTTRRDGGPCGARIDDLRCVCQVRPPPAA